MKIYIPKIIKFNLSLSTLLVNVAIVLTLINLLLTILFFCYLFDTKRNSFGLFIPLLYNRKYPLRRGNAQNFLGPILGW